MAKRYDMTTEYNRYACEDQVVPVESSSGDYVEYTEYESLESDYNVLRRDYQNLVDKLGELYKGS